MSPQLPLLRKMPGRNHSTYRKQRERIDLPYCCLLRTGSLTVLLARRSELLLIRKIPIFSKILSEPDKPEKIGSVTGGLNREG